MRLRASLRLIRKPSFYKTPVNISMLELLLERFNPLQSLSLSTLCCLLVLLELGKEMVTLWSGRLASFLDKDLALLSFGLATV